MRNPAFLRFVASALLICLFAMATATYFTVEDGFFWGDDLARPGVLGNPDATMGAPQPFEYPTRSW